MPAKAAVKKSAPDYGEYEPHPAADVFPLMKQEDLQKLANDIKESGQLDDIEVLAGTKQIVDGRNRYLACVAAGVEPRIKEISMDGMPYGIYEYAVSKNLLRRQLTAGQRQAVVKKLREDGHSIRAIADLTGIPKSTVADDLRQASETGQLEQPEKIEGKDGRSRPATMPQNGDDETGDKPSKALAHFRDVASTFTGFTSSLHMITIPDDAPADEMARHIKTFREGRTSLGKFIKRMEGDDLPESPEPEITAAGDEPSTKQVNEWLKSEGRGAEVTRGQVSKALKAEYLAAHKDAES